MAVKLWRGTKKPHWDTSGKIHAGWNLRESPPPEPCFTLEGRSADCPIVIAAAGPRGPAPVANASALVSHEGEGSSLVSRRTLP